MSSDTEFIEQYLSLIIQVDFGKNVLSHLGLNSNEVEKVIYDTYGNFQITLYHPLLKNIRSILSKTDVLNSDNLSKFQEKN